MPWEPVDMITLRQEFVSLALQEGANRRALCQRYGISPKTGYKWIERFSEQGQAGLEDRSRRPIATPGQTDQDVTQAVLQLRHRHPTWGGRKIHRRLQDLGYEDAPAPSTVTHILRRHGLINQAASERNKPWQRFEHDSPNDLWQMDFKGQFRAGNALCYPLTVLDDHSRFNLVLQGCSKPNRELVQDALIQAFRRYGLPRRINVDNGPPWGSPSKHEHGITKLTIWLIRLGIHISHSRPAHPQTNGKEERFHRTLKQDLIEARGFRDLDDAQQAFNCWRSVYNTERPHDAIGLATPISRYQPSPVSYPDTLEPIEYPQDDLVLDVGWDGKAKLLGRKIRVSNALRDYRIAARPVPNQDGKFDLYFLHQRIGQVDLREIETCC